MDCFVTSVNFLVENLVEKLKCSLGENEGRMSREIKLKTSFFASVGLS